jgi:hypothetical protein
MSEPMDQHQLLALWRRRINEACALMKYGHTETALTILGDVAGQLFIAQILGMPSDEPVDEP